MKVGLSLPFFDCWEPVRRTSLGRREFVSIYEKIEAKMIEIILYESKPRRYTKN